MCQLPLYIAVVLVELNGTPPRKDDDYPADPTSPNKIICTEDDSRIVGTYFLLNAVDVHKSIRFRAHSFIRVVIMSSDTVSLTVSSRRKLLNKSL